MRILRVEKERDKQKLLLFNPANGSLFIEEYELAYEFSDDYRIEVECICAEHFLDEDEYRIIQNKSVKNSYSAPIKLYIDITDKCNLSCLHCLNKNLHSKNELSMKTIHEVADECGKYGVFYVKLGGGEPLAHPHIAEIINEFRKKNVFVSLSTNGILINEEIAEVLKSGRVRTTVSIEGPRELDDSIRGAGHFDKAVDSLMLLRKKGVDVNFRTTLTNKILNTTYLDQLKTLALECDVKVKFAYCKPSGNAIENSVIMGFDDHFAYQKIIERLNSDESFIIENGMTYEQNDHFRKLYFQGKGCGAGTRTMYMNAKMQLSSCVFLGDKFYASDTYKEGGIMDFWRDESNEMIHLLRNLPFPDECYTCKRNCNGQCIALRLYHTGNMLGRNPNCLC